MEHQTRTRRMLLSSASMAAVCTLAFATSAMAQTAVDDTKVEDVVVTARRAAMESAIERKKNADSVVDVVVADDAGKLPDNSITEILQRVSGVSIVRFSALNDPDHFSAEGSGIQVRGLSGVAARLNGREIFSASGGRGLSWGDVTPELMSAVTVYKSPTADLIEGGTGGQIDLRTKMPFDFRQTQTLGVTLNGSHGDLADKYDGGASVLFSRRWETGFGDIGLVADLAYNRLTSHSDFLRMEPYYKTRIGANDRFIPGGYTFGNEDFERTRTGAYLALAWRPTDELEFYTTAFTSKYENSSRGAGRFVTSQNLVADETAAGGTEYDANGGLVRTNRLFVRSPTTFLADGSNINAGGNTGVSDGQSVTSDYAAGFSWTPGKWGVKGALQVVESSSDRDSYDAFLNAPFPTEYGLDLRGEFPVITIPASGAALFANRALYAWTATQPHAEHNFGHLYSANVDAEYMFENEFVKSVKFGARLGDRTERDQNNGYNWAALGAGWNGAPVHNAVEQSPPLANGSRPGDTQLHTFENFFRGDAQLPAQTFLPSFEMVAKRDRVGDHTFYGGLAGIQQVRYTDQQYTTYRTQNQSVYGMIRFASDTILPIKFSGNVGARWIRVENESTGYFTQPNNSSVLINGVINTTPPAGTGPGLLRDEGLTFTKVLPSLNLTFEPSESVRIRAAANITLDNPTFNSLRASGNVSFVTDCSGVPTGQVCPLTGYTTTSGNPRLKPMISNNLDLTAEWYPKRGTQLHVSGFYKNLEDVLITAPGQKIVPITFAVPTARSELVAATSVDTANASEDAIIKGFEIGGRTFLDMLPKPFDGFGIEANYTYIESDNPGDRYLDINTVRGRTSPATVDPVGQYNLPVAGLSKDNLNVTLLYEKDKISARLAYSWRSEYLMSTNTNGTNGEYIYRTQPGAATCPNPPVSPTPTYTCIDISLPIYADDYGTLDAGITYRLSDKISVSLEGSNLTNEVTKTLMGGYNNGQKYVRSWFVSDRRTNLSIRFSY